MRWGRRVTLLALSMVVGVCHELPAEQKNAVLKALQGEWLHVETWYRDPTDPTRKWLHCDQNPDLVVEFIGNIGIPRKVRQDGSRSKPGPYRLAVDPRTDPINCDQEIHGFGVRRGILKVEKDRLFLALASPSAPDDRPKTFDVVNDPNCFSVTIFQRIKR